MLDSSVLDTLLITVARLTLPAGRFGLFMLCLLAGLNGPAMAADGEQSFLESDIRLSREGYFVLNWSLVDAPEGRSQQVVQQAQTPSFIQPETYEVPTSGQMTLSGLADGEYYFRAGREGNWTETVQVTVQHHSLARALVFFLAGLILFIILVIVILRGNRAHDVEHSRRETQHDG